MEINFDFKRIKNDPVTPELVQYFQENEDVVSLKEAQLYYDFPVLKDIDDKIIIAKLLLISRKHGILLIAPLAMTDGVNIKDELEKADTELDHIFSMIYSCIRFF